MTNPGFDLINYDPAEETVDAEFNFGAKFREIIKKIKAFFDKLFKRQTL